MTIDTNKKILIVGLGLIGGSYAMALTKKGYKVSAITKEKADIEYAIKKGIISDGSDEVDPNMIGNADLVIFALYPKIFLKWIEENQKYFKEGALITDVTGVKECIVYKIQQILREDVEYIPAHPMAGKEVLGVKNSDDAIFSGANYIVTPTEKNTKEATEVCLELGRILGFKSVSVLSPYEHDKMIGFLSQLTHCIAVTLMTCNTEENLERYTGDSFRDLTRIARIDENLWSELFLSNREALLEQMQVFSGEFQKLKGMIENGDTEGLKQMMRLSSERRSRF